MLKKPKATVTDLSELSVMELLRETLGLAIQLQGKIPAEKELLDRLAMAVRYAMVRLYGNDQHILDQGVK